MTALRELIGRGGVVMIAILALSVILYSRCFKLLMLIRRQRNRLSDAASAEGDPVDGLRASQEELGDNVRNERIVLGSLIAAAPLLGLLGTVSGMVTTFESLSGRTAEKSMEGLARGISEVLVATESGLAVAIPGLLILHLAHRSHLKCQQRMNELERAVWLDAKP
jgi:biopolymer transport protein ExbB